MKKSKNADRARLGAAIAKVRSESSDQEALVKSMFGMNEFFDGSLGAHKDLLVFGAFAKAGLRLDKKRVADQSMLAAFADAGLDWQSPIHWRKLMQIFCDLHYGPKPVKKKKQTPENHAAVLRDYLITRKKHPRLSSEESIARAMRRGFQQYARYDVDALRKVVRNARNPKLNPILRYPEIESLAIRVLRGKAEDNGQEWSPQLEALLVEIERRVIVQEMGKT